MKHILAISWTMPPLLMPRSIQVTRTLNRLAELDWATTVLCASPLGLDARITIDPSLEKALGRNYHPVEVASPQPSLPLRALERYFFLEHLVWIFKAISQGKELLKSEKFAAIISFAQPWASHLVGLRLHRLSGLPWVAHFSDPWVDSPYLREMPWQRILWRKLENAVIRDADAVFFVNSQTADLVMGKYPSPWRQKTFIMPHGFEAGAVPKMSAAAGPGRRLRLVYTGRFYRDRRTPEALFHALKMVEDTRDLADQLEVRLIGPFASTYQNLAQKMGLGEIVSCRDEVPYSESVAEMAAADVLLVIDAPDKGPNLFLPSKLVEYLAFKKPILGLTPEQGASADLLRHLGCPLVSPDDPAGIARALTRLLDLWQAGQLSVPTEFPAAARQYDIRETTRQLAGVLDDLTVNSFLLAEN